jgi:hypothetical protein
MSRAATAVDPVAAAEQRLADAEQALADAKAEADSVYAGMLTGERQVSAEQFAAARHAVEHAAAVRDGATEALTQARTAARLDRIRAIVAPVIEGDTSDTRQIEDAAAQIESAVRTIIGICSRQRGVINGAIAALRREGVPERKTHRDAEVASDHAGVTFADASWGNRERVIVDRKEFGAVNPTPIIGDALRRGAVQWPGIVNELAGVRGY